MKCPYCGYSESRVIDSRPTDEGERIRRRRECLKCGKRFTTYEVIENVPIVVIKKDKSRETFDRSKLLNGLLRACEKRPVSMDTLERIVDEIENLLQNIFDGTTPVYFKFEDSGQRMRAPQSMWANDHPLLRAELERILGKDHVKQQTAK